MLSTGLLEVALPPAASATLLTLLLRRSPRMTLSV